MCRQLAAGSAEFPEMCRRLAAASAQLPEMCRQLAGPFEKFPRMCRQLAGPFGKVSGGFGDVAGEIRRLLGPGQPVGAGCSSWRWRRIGRFVSVEVEIERIPQQHGHAGVRRKDPAAGGFHNTTLDLQALAFVR